MKNKLLPPICLSISVQIIALLFVSCVGSPAPTTGIPPITPSDTVTITSTSKSPNTPTPFGNPDPTSTFIPLPSIEEVTYTPVITQNYLTLTSTATPFWGTDVAECDMSSNPPYTPCIYTVMFDDSYYSIAKKFYGEEKDANEIRDFNRTTEGTYHPSLRPGMKLYIRNINADHYPVFFKPCSDNSPPCWYQLLSHTTYEHISQQFFGVEECADRISQANRSFQGQNDNPIALYKDTRIMIPARSHQGNGCSLD